MRSLSGLLVSSLILITLIAFAWLHLRKSADSVEIKAAPLIEQARKAQQTSAELPGSQPSTTVVGPLAQFMNQNEENSKSDKIETRTYTPVASDHVSGSVVGTSITILQDKFRVANVVHVPFDVPAHASMPQLHGRFRSFIQPNGKPSSDTNADIDFRVLTEEEFTHFVSGQPSEPLFAADATHDQEVNASLPPTLNKAVQYHMIFVNGSRSTRKVVQPDFRLDF